MNAVRLTCKNGERKFLLVQSTLDKTYKLDERTDEEIQFDRDALVILKSVSEYHHRIKLKVTRCEHDQFAKEEGRIVVHSTRRATMYMRNQDEASINMLPGEVLQVRSSIARTPQSNRQVLT